MFCPDCGTWNRTRAFRCTRCTALLPELQHVPTERPDDELSALRRATAGRYRVMKRLGSGGMAHVYYALHPSLERPLVIKVLHTHLARDSEMRERFRREAESASKLVHPNICPIIDYAETNDVVYIVMPYLTGGSLADILVRDRKLAPIPSATACAQVAVALDYAHRRGVVHRDVKPDNVIFDEDRHALLTDFGIATARSQGRLTGTGRAMGTPHYMSPEQAMGRIVDGRSDLYAVGVMLYEMVLGFPPFDGADSYSIGYKHVHEMPVLPDVIDSSVPPELSAIIMRCLAKSADDRYQRGFDLADALLAYTSVTSTSEEMRTAWVARRSVGALLSPL